jgi:flagellar motility protein MotE (MotC chaperone)
MKKVLGIVVLTLALNFLGVVGAVGYLFQSGHLDKSKISQLKKVLFSPPSSGSAPTTQPGAVQGTESASRTDLSRLLARGGGKSAIEQVELLRRTFDSQMLEIDQRQRELADLQKQVDLANQKLAADRAALDKREKSLADREQAAQRLQDDAGFQTSLALYSAMPPKQVKSIFMTLSEATVQQYLQAMDARTAGKIIKEFKTTDETAFIQRIMERIRQSQVSSTDGKPS